MNLSNAVYLFAKALVEAALPGTALENSVVHADTYEEMNEAGGTKFIRVDDLIGSIPQPFGVSEIHEYNAVLDVQFLQIPVDQTLDKRLLARQTTDDMALALIAAVYADQRLGTIDHSICDCSVQKMNGWRKVGNVKTPISIVRLSMNKK